MVGSMDLGCLLQFRPLFSDLTNPIAAASEHAALRFYRKVSPPALLRASPRAVEPPRCLRSGDLHDAEIGVPAAVPLARSVSPDLVEKMLYDALVWSSLHGLIVGDRRVQNSGSIPGVGLVHAPFALLPMLFPQNYWRQACELAPIFNELVDRNEESRCIY